MENETLIRADGEIVDAEITSLEKPDLSKLSTTETFDRFLRLSVADGYASARTLSTYREGLKIFLAWCQSAGPDPRKATYDDIQEYRKHLTEKCRPSTVRVRLRAVRILYQAFQRWGMRKDNPAEGIKAPRDRTSAGDRALGKALSPEEANRLWCFTTHETYPAARDKAIIALMLWQGLRAEEITSLQMSDLDWQALDSLKVNGKGNKIRTVYLSAPAREALYAWINKRQGELGRFPLFYDLQNHGSLPIPGESTLKRLSVRTIERIVDRYLLLAGLKKPGRSAHALRHTYAVLSVLGGAQREILADSMGHANLSATDVYIRAAARLQSNPAEAAWKFAQEDKVKRRP